MQHIQRVDQLSLLTARIVHDMHMDAAQVDAEREGVLGGEMHSS
jgi:hypothetical protein